MKNPNNCATCAHKGNPQGGWCYMFREEPTEVCMQHSGRRTAAVFVCPEKDIVCGLNPGRWCGPCPMRREPPNKN